MSNSNDRLRRLEAAIPPSQARHPYDLSRLTVAQKERMAELRERVDAVGMDALTDQEIEEGAAIEEILVAPVWPAPEPEAESAPRFRSTEWTTTWRR